MKKSCVHPFLCLLLVTQLSLSVNGAETKKVTSPPVPKPLSPSDTAELKALQQEYVSVLGGLDKMLLECDKHVQTLIKAIAEGLVVAADKDKISEVSSKIKELKNYKPESTAAPSACNYSEAPSEEPTASTTTPKISNSGNSLLDFNKVSLELACVSFLGTAAFLLVQ